MNIIKLTEKDLVKTIKSGNMEGLYVLFGPEKYLISYYSDNIIRSIVGKTPNDFNLQTFTNNVNIDEISISVESLPLFSGKKCVFIKDLDAESLKDKDREKLIEIFSDIPESTVVVISYPTLEINLRKSSKFKKFFSKLESLGKIVNIEKRDAKSLEKQLVKWAEKRNTTLSANSANKIIKLCGDDLNTLSSEIEKLCAYSDYSEITDDMIEKVVIKNFETTVFILSNSIVKKDYNSAMEQLDLLFYKREEPIAILAVLSSAFIDMYRVRIAEESGHNSSELTEFFDYKNKAFRLSNAKKNSRNLSTKNIRDCINILTETDIKLKSTRTNKKILLEELIAKLMMIL